MTDTDKAKQYETLRIFAALCLFIAGCALFFFIGKGNNQKELDYLHELNRSDFEVLNIPNETVYVIGHKNPDADTVCSAIAMAELMRKLGYDAEAGISGPVDRETAYILKSAGVDTPPILEDVSGKPIILVDHSEYAQAAEGMKDATIVAVLDHHGVGSITTGNTILYDARPLGAAATILWMKALGYGIDFEPSTARLLLGAILSDTSNLTGTFTTYADKEAASALARTAGVNDVKAFYDEMHREKLSYEGMSSEEIFFSDYKKYDAGGTAFGIGLMSAVDEDSAKELAGKMKEAFPSLRKQADVDLLYAQVTIRENGEKIDYIIAGDELSGKVLEEAFPEYDEYDGTSFIFRKGLGRKTKFVPGLTEHLMAYPKE